MATLKIAWKEFSEGALKPKRNKDGDAGFDLYATEDIVIKRKETILVDTGYAVQQTPPKGWNSFGKVEDTSGNALKVKLKTAGGVVDRDYQGKIGVIIRNNSFKKITIKKGAKVAQIVFHLLPLIEEVEWVDKETDRGDAGFGSSGVATDK